jgi:putative phosphoesterase
VKTVGLVSDTHGLLRPQALVALGDVGSAAVLGGLRALAPLVAVRGNNDSGAWAKGLPASEVVEVDGALLYVLHDLAELDLDPAAAGFHAVVSGHSHRPKIERRGDVLFVNPGSIGPRRFTLPVALAILRVDGVKLAPRIVQLDP